MITSDSGFETANRSRYSGLAILGVEKPPGDAHKAIFRQLIFNPS